MFNNLKQNIDMCKKNKKLKNLPYRFFIDALSENGKVSWEAYGADRRRLGKALLEVAKKSGFDLPKSDTNCYAATNYLEELGVIARTKDGFIPSETWMERVIELFPKESIQQQKQEVPQETISSTDNVEPVVEVEASSVEEETPQEEAPKNFIELYNRVLEWMKSEYRSKADLKAFLDSMYLEIFGCRDTTSMWWHARVKFLERNALIESIEDQGTTMFLRNENFLETLEKKKNDSRLTKEFVIKDEQPEVKMEEEEKKEETKVEKSIKTLTGIQDLFKQKEEKEKRTICVCLKKGELHKLYETHIKYEGQEDYVVIDIEPNQANLDVLKMLPQGSVSVNLQDRKKLKELYREERENLLKSLERINLLTGEE